MAGDWIKFDVTTPDKPEVVQMAAVLGIDQDAVVGKLLRVWAWADQNTVTCNGASNGVTVTSSFLDRITFCQGFASAMRLVGWLNGNDGALVFTNFGLHNGKTAKERAVSNRRVAKHRACNGIGNADVTPPPLQEPLQKPLPEKRVRAKAIHPRFARMSRRFRRSTHPRRLTSGRNARRNLSAWLRSPTMPSRRTTPSWASRMVCWLPSASLSAAISASSRSSAASRCSAKSPRKNTAQTESRRSSGRTTSPSARRIRSATAPAPTHRRTTTGARTSSSSPAQQKS